MRAIQYLALLLISTIVFGQSSTLDPENLEQIEKEQKVKGFTRNESYSLTLQGAIELGLRKNFSENIRKFQFELNEFSYQDAFDDFYMPKLNLTMATTSDHHVENLYKESDSSATSPQTPAGAVGLELEDYTLFNWGKDYIDYLNAKESYGRTKTSFTEKRRALRHNIIDQYFNLSRQFQIVQAYKRQLSHTSFIYRLAKEKLSLKKIRLQEFLQAKSLFLVAHQNYQSSLNDYYSIQDEMATLLGHELKTTYWPAELLKFKPVTLAATESLPFIEKNNPSLLQARANMNISTRSYQRTVKDNLPLPKISLKLGSYQRSFSSAGQNDNYETFSGSKNLEVVATLNMSWRIYGSGGFFNSRKTKSSFLNKRISEIELRETHRSVKVANRLIHSQIKYLEKKLEATEAFLKNARKGFDQTVDDYLASKVPLTTLQQILEDLIQSQIEYENTKYMHLSEKVNLAELMGVDDFPGENFDKLTRSL